MNAHTFHAIALVCNRKSSSSSSSSSSSLVVDINSIGIINFISKGKKSYTKSVWSKRFISSLIAWSHHISIRIVHTRDSHYDFRVYAYISLIYSCVSFLFSTFLFIVWFRFFFVQSFPFLSGGFWIYFFFSCEGTCSCFYILSMMTYNHSFTCLLNFHCIGHFTLAFEWLLYISRGMHWKLETIPHSIE